VSCKRCGYGNARSANICPKCGHDVPHTSDDVLNYGIAIVILIGGLVYLLLR
jgi:RNA polymerase subunit RPABC4/transcription elongation factor Spt4